MKILFVLNSLTPGGTETSTVASAGALIALGHEATIATLGPADHGLESRSRSAGVPVRRLQSTSTLGQIRELRHLLRTGAYDVIHTALYRADQIGRIAAVGCDLAVVSSFVNTPYEGERFSDPNVTKWKVRLLQLLDALTAHLCVDRFHAVSEGVKTSNARALRVRRDKIEVVERGRDPKSLGDCTTERRKRARSELELDDDDEVVLSLGRLDHQKGQTVLIRAMEELRDHPRAILLIAGKDGSAADAVRGSTDAARVHGTRIRLLGHRSDVGTLLVAADALAITSYFEGTAGAAVEAMALSTPVVATAIPGVNGVLEHERNALLVTVDDPHATAAALHSVLADSEVAQRLAAEGRRTFEAKFDLDVATEKLAGFYEALCLR